jgi:hypothetical protein
MKIHITFSSAAAGPTRIPFSVTHKTNGDHNEQH